MTGWTLYNGNIYRASVTVPTGMDPQVFVGGQMMLSARYPNSGLDLLHPTRALAGSGSNTSTVNDASLPTISGGLAGAIIHCWCGNAWMSETGTVTSSGTGTFAFSGANGECAGSLTYLCMGAGSTYYLTGKLGLLDAPGEFYYDSSSSTLYLWSPAGGAPSGVEVKKRTNAFDLSGRSFIDINGLNFTGSTITTSATSSHNTFDRVSATYVSDFATIPDPDPTTDSVAAAHLFDSGIILNGSYETLKNSSIAYSAGNGVAVLGTNETVVNNLIHDTDYMGTWSATVYVRGQHDLITQNTLYNTGRDGMTGNYGGDGIFGGGYTDFTNNTISYNDVFNYGLLNADLGGIYVCCTADGTGSSIDHNAFHDNLVAGGSGLGVGIYIDNGSGNFLIHHNESYNNQGWGIIFNANGGAATGYGDVYNNTLGSGQGTSIQYNSSSIPNSAAQDNIVATPISAPSGVTQSNNLTTTTGFISSTTPDFRLSSAASAVNAGITVAGITTNAVGAPDVGAHEFTGTDWTPGCNFASCQFPKASSNSIDDTSSAVTYSGTGWTHCTTGCSSTFGGTLYGDTISYSNHAGDTATVTFTGVQAQIYGLTGFAGVGSISVDGGPVTNVDWATAHAVSGVLFTTQLLTNGTHTITFTVTGTGQYGTAAWINLDRVTVTPGSSTTASVDDAVTGTSDSTWTFSGSGWTHCTTGCNATFGTTFQSGTISYDNVNGDYAIMSFVGTGVALYGYVGGGGSGGVQVDQLPETAVSWYSPTPTTALMYTSPPLPWGAHTIKVRVGSGYVNVDQAVVNS